MKKREKLICLIVIILLIFNPIGSLSYLNDSLDERISKTFGKERSYATVEFEDGYICIFSKEVGNEECLTFAYLKKELFGETGFNIRASMSDNYDYFLNNKSLKRCYKLPMNNFSNKTIYFSCCEEEYIESVEVNGEKVELSKVEIPKEEKIYTRYFLFYLGEDDVYPIIKTEKE